MSLHATKPAHEIAYQDLCQLMRKHSKLTPLEMLAIAANMVGKLVAMQDQRSTTPAMAMEVVAKNIENGNQMIIDQLAKGPSAGRA